jgi:sec-independent protein translocase protein TatB
VFDVSFSELLVIAIVALLVIGPEKLPKVARTMGALTGRLQRYIAQVKEEVNREARFDELQKLQEEIKQGVAQAEEGFKSQARDIEQKIKFPSVAKTKTLKSVKKTSVKKSTVKTPKDKA